MKLSDVKGDRCLDVVADIIGPICSIAEDKDAVELFKPKKAPKGMTANQYFAKRMKAGVPKLLKHHKDDVVEILSVIQGVKPDEYLEGLTLPKLITDVLEMLTDKDIVAFLSSQQATDGSLTGASESTQDREG